MNDSSCWQLGCTVGNVGTRVNVFCSAKPAVSGTMLQESFSESFHKSVSDRSDQTFDQAYLICNHADNRIRV